MVSSLQSAIHVTIEFPLIFGETNFVEVPKIHEISEICSPQKSHPTVMRSQEQDRPKAISKLQKDLINNPLHCFRCHEKCSPDFCKMVQ